MADKSQLILRDSFEGDGFSSSSGLFYKDNEEQSAGTFRFGSAAGRSGGKALELAIAPGTRPRGEGGSERAEVWEHANVRADYGRTVWYALSLKLEEPLPGERHRMMVAQWKRAMLPEAGGVYSPFLAIRIIRGEFAITIDSDAMPTTPRRADEPLFSRADAAAPAMQRARAGQTRLLVAASADDPAEAFPDFDGVAPDVRVIHRGGRLPRAEPRWIDFVVKAKPGPRGDGEIEIFCDGGWIASVAGRIGHEGPDLGPTQYFKFGPYRDSGRSDGWRVLYDDFARGPRCEDVAGPEICRNLVEARQPDPAA